MSQGTDQQMPANSAVRPYFRHGLQPPVQKGSRRSPRTGKLERFIVIACILVVVVAIVMGAYLYTGNGAAYWGIDSV